MQNSRLKLKYICSKYQFKYLMILLFGFFWISVPSIINHKIIELNGFEKTVYFWGLLCLGIFVVGEIIIRIIQMLVCRIRIEDFIVLFFCLVYNNNTFLMVIFQVSKCRTLIGVN
ncbi:hypothetical protein QFZ77_007433 [Paenibacillus sp. V4I3]|nr:hypothetical protein [Paenibacillus sp. V4I3]MDQ0885374.1 hypothetical protein [Paenibacillus sp. V4I9]